MTSHQILKSKIEKTYTDLSSEAKSVNVRSKLSRINLACEYLSKNAVISIASVVNYLSSQGVKLTKRTVYNKRDGGNPYRELIDTWIEYSEYLHNQKSNTKLKGSSSSALGLVDDNDLAKIQDITLRHKFSLMYAELRSLKNQINIIKDVESLPTIYPQMDNNQLQDGSDLTFDDKLPLSDYELEVIKNLLKPTVPSLSYDEDGALISTSVIKRGEQLSMEGLKDILSKVMKMHEKK